MGPKRLWQDAGIPSKGRWTTGPPALDRLDRLQPARVPTPLPLLRGTHEGEGEPGVPEHPGDLARRPVAPVGPAAGQRLPGTAQMEGTDPGAPGRALPGVLHAGHQRAHAHRRERGRAGLGGLPRQPLQGTAAVHGVRQRAGGTTGRRGAEAAAPGESSPARAGSTCLSAYWPERRWRPPTPP